MRADYDKLLNARSQSVETIFVMSASNLRAFPDYLACFNLLTGSRPKHNVSVDSNLDWGQSLPPAREFSRAHPGTIAIDYFRGIDARTYVPNVIPWACDTPMPAGTELAVVSATPFLTRKNCRYLLSYPTTPLWMAEACWYSAPAPRVQGFRRISRKTRGMGTIGKLILLITLLLEASALNWGNGIGIGRLFWWIPRGQPPGQIPGMLNLS